MTRTTNPSDPFTLFEVSWEVCNKVGGIHTVVSSKARTLVDRLGDDYVAIGPLLLDESSSSSPFEPEAGFEELADACRARGVDVQVGRWRTGGDPRTVLVGFSRLFEQKDALLARLWEDHRVDSISGGWDYVEPVVFGHAAAILIEEWHRLYVEPRGLPAVAQFHEWMCGSGLLRLRHSLPQVGTVFTTHATMLGRSLSATGKPPAEALGGRRPDEVAQAQGVRAKHSIEGVVAREADVFTTVSEITAREADLLHGRKADPLLPNGLDLEWVAELASRPGATVARERLARIAGALVGEDVSDAAFLCISGRYEFHNKGIDVLLDAAAQLEGRPGRRVVLFAMVPAGTAGLRRGLHERLAHQSFGDGPMGRLTHELFDPDGDPIRQRCQELGLNNAAGSRVKVVHAPVYLPSGAPLDLEYEAALAAMDLTCFPSFYEPWGYTPPESLAVGVPTVTTDRAGFGVWARENGLGEADGVYVLERTGKDMPQVASELCALLERAIDDASPSRREACLSAARTVDWHSLIVPYEEAFRRALARGAARQATAAPRHPLPQRAPDPGLGSTPRLFTFDVSARLPEVLRPLERLANNLWWCWDPEAERLFRDLSPHQWEATRGNPVALLRRAWVRDLEERAADPAYRARLDRVLERFDAYMAEPQRSFEDAGRTVLGPDAPVAYFCFEYGLHPSLAIYSGGLGVLAGDHLKSASDTALPLVAVGLFYRSGYVSQRLTSEGEQLALPQPLDPAELPLNLLRDEQGAPLEVVLRLPSGELRLRLWEVAVGRVRLVLLDADHEGNGPEERAITRSLYAGDSELRLRQEIVLGKGGVRALQALGVRPAVLHMNEGHAGFAALERAAQLVRDEHLTFGEALEVVRGSTAFTTHTPVPAGHDVFGEDLMRRYFADAPSWIGLPWEKLLTLGADASGQGAFNMTYLCVNVAGFVNGVAQKHGEVSRDLLQPFWRGLLRHEVPVTHVTNGVHLATWVREGLVRLLGVQERGARPDDFARAKELDVDALWRERCAARHDLLEALRANVREAFVRRDDDPKLAARMLEHLRDDALVIGFARRFAPYKRATLLFLDELRLARLLEDPERPVVFVFAGKAHPRDGRGKDLVAHVARLTRREPFLGKVLFLEDYDLSLARKLKQGADVWLNNPTRPLEASGTSGMKVAANGGLNLSILDGWWIEGCDGRNGWAIGGDRVYPDQPRQDQLDNEVLLRLLEDEVVPLYFDRDAAGVPRRWMERVLHALATLPGVFNTDRMVEEYLERAYVPLAVRHADRTEGGFQGARTRAATHRRLRKGFRDVRVLAARVGDLSALGTGDHVQVELDVQLGQLTRDDLVAELVLGHPGGGLELHKAHAVPLQPLGDPIDGVQTYHGTYELRAAGAHGYGLRIRTKVAFDDDPARARLVTWA